MPNLYLVLTPDFQIIGASDSYLEATMVKRENVLGHGLFEIFPDNPDDAFSKSTGNLRASLMRVLQKKAPDAMPVQKYDIKRPDAAGGGFEERYWSPLNTPVLGNDGQILYIVHRVEDVTDFVRIKREGVENFMVAEALRSEKDLLEKQRQSQRMEAMGALAGGVAHDFNNLLSVILLTCEAALADLQITTNLRKQLSQISLSAKKAASLTRQLLAFSRKQILQFKVINLNSVIQNIQELLQRLLTENIQFEFSLASDLKNILADQGQLEQVILNLVVNSRDAMPSGGKITIETSNVILDEEMSSGNMRVSPGPYTMLSVRDTGVGMDARTQARMFEPFFSTKGALGTGLGLATVYGIVSQNKGNIWVYSELNKGSVFKIYFPQATQQEEAPSTEETAQGLKVANQTLLIVEDQEHLRNLMYELLQNEGFQVYQAENGVVALKVLEKLDYKVDLIITDVIMPEMGGQALASRLASQGHKNKILFLSGFAGDVLSTNHGDSAPHFLEKPFNHATLLKKINSILSDSI